MISVLELFKIGVGPSSSHTVGPMKAAAAFADGLRKSGAIAHVAAVEATLFGSLAFTGKGHATDKAVILGLSGLTPETVDPDEADALTAEVRETNRLRLAGARAIPFDPATAIVFDVLTPPPRHPTRPLHRPQRRRRAARRRDLALGRRRLHRARRRGRGRGRQPCPRALSLPLGNRLPVLLARGRESRSFDRGAHTSQRGGATPRRNGGSACRKNSRRHVRLPRAGPYPDPARCPAALRSSDGRKKIFDRLAENARRNAHPAHEIMDFVSVYAMAVNEENAAGGRVVTAPTNGAAGVIPAVLRYYRDHCDGATRAGLADFLMSASAIGGLFKLNASISGAEVGCQGEVGVASSMAAAGLCAALGGSNAQIENAAEIAMEHHLGMTCDPVGGLVQIPCIERNAFGAVKAIAAASLALHGDGRHRVSLDSVIKTMRQTGADMQSKYKETSLGGLAVNFVEC